MSLWHAHSGLVVFHYPSRGQKADNFIEGVNYNSPHTSHDFHVDYVRINNTERGVLNINELNGLK